MVSGCLAAELNSGVGRGLVALLCQVGVHIVLVGNTTAGRAQGIDHALVVLTERVLEGRKLARLESVEILKLSRGLHGGLLGRIKRVGAVLRHQAILERGGVLLRAPGRKVLIQHLVERASLGPSDLGLILSGLPCGGVRGFLGVLACVRSDEGTGPGNRCGDGGCGAQG